MTYLGCEDCQGAGCRACAVHGPDGNYQLGIVPFLVAPLVAQLFRRRRRMQQRQPTQAQPSAVALPAAPTQPPPGVLATIQRIVDAQPVPDDPEEPDTDNLEGTTMFPPPNLLGAPWRPFQGFRRRCVRRQTPQGTAIVDADTNELVGYEEGVGADSFDAIGAEADLMGFDDDGDDDDDEIGADELGAEIDDAIGYAEATGDDQVLGGADDKLERKMSRLQDQIATLREKSANVRQPFAQLKRKKIAKKIAAKQRALSKLRSKQSRLRGAQRRVNAAAAGLVPAATSAGAGAAMAALAQQGIGGPPVLGTRTFMNRPTQQLLDPRAMAAMRRQLAAEGLRFGATAPPGSGRITNVPFYQDPDDGNPRNSLTVPVAGITAATQLQTRNLPYATCTVIGFKTSLYGTDSANSAVGLVRNLQTGGGTNLFLAQGWLNASDFSDPQALQGLRANPQLQTTNYALVDVAAAGDTDDVVTMTCSLVVDVIADDTYGAGLPGPYAG